MKNLFYLLTGILFLSCSQQDPKDYIQYLNGYWEIERVITKDGSEKEYKFNPLVDFFEVKDSIGVRKKVRPQLDGKFIITKDYENFSLRIENDSLRIYYQNQLTSWKETILFAKENQIIIQNEIGNQYFYKPYHKLEL